jgi:type VI secretion system protein ImpE
LRQAVCPAGAFLHIFNVVAGPVFSTPRDCEFYMTALDHLKAGNLAETYDALTAEIRKSPADAKLRVFLFQLLCVRGEWSRALTQLKVCGEMAPDMMTMVQTYREAIACEMLREKVFAGETAPLVFGEPTQWMALMIQALGPMAKGDVTTAAALREEAFELAPSQSGEADGVAFDWIADADMRLGPILELIMNGRYFWAPFSTIKRITMEPPTDLRDRVWSAAEITWVNGGDVVGFIPTRYPGSAQSGRSGVMLANETDWVEAGAETYLGLGQRLFTTNNDDLALLDIRSLSLSAAGAGDGAH